MWWQVAFGVADAVEHYEVWLSWVVEFVGVSGVAESAGEDDVAVELAVEAVKGSYAGEFGLDESLVVEDGVWSDFDEHCASGPLVV